MTTSFIRASLSRTCSWNRASARTGRTTLQQQQRPGQHGKERSYRVYSTATGSQPGISGRRTVRLSYALVTTALVGSTAYVLGLFAPPPMFQLLNPRPAPAPLAAESAEGKEYTARIEQELLNLRVLKELRRRDDADEWYETRPYVSLPLERLVNHFTGGALRGPGRIAVPPLVRSRKDETETFVFVHLGRGVCGHDGIVHGGLLATLLDEGCGRNAILAFPSRTGVTANLNIDYKAPTMADQFVVMKTRLVELKGRKAIVHGQIEDLQGNVLVQAKALFIEPKIAGALNAAGISAIFPTTKRVAHMTGAHGRVEGSGGGGVGGGGVGGGGVGGVGGGGGGGGGGQRGEPTNTNEAAVKRVS